MCRKLHRWIGSLLAAAILFSLLPTFAAATGETLTLKYDDYYTAEGAVTILDAGTPTSNAVKVQKNESGYANTLSQKDSAVVELDAQGRLHAVGVGTASVSIGGQTVAVTVEPAKLSLFFVIGQSNAEGIDGSADQSIANEDGQVYASYGEHSALTVDNAPQFVPAALTGENSKLNTVGTTAQISAYPADMLTESGGGKIGLDSGLAYEWTQQTGEKVWMVNAAHSGTSLLKWQPDTDNYEEAVAMFTAAEAVAAAEVAAGHFTLEHMGYFWLQGENNHKWKATQYLTYFSIMHEGLKSELQTEIGGKARTLEFANLLLVRFGPEDGTASYREGPAATSAYPYYESFLELRMSGPRVAQIYMANSREAAYADVNLVCDIGDGWSYDKDGNQTVAAFFAARYPHGIDYPVQNAVLTLPTAPADVHPKIHYTQVGYNELGRESGRNTYYLLHPEAQPAAEPSVTFYEWDGVTAVPSGGSHTVGTSADWRSLIVPRVSPVYLSKQVTYTVTGDGSYTNYDAIVTGSSAVATLTASTGESITVCGENAPAELPEEEGKQMRLWYTSAAADTMDGWKKLSLPLGNGYMGVNVFGGAQTELLSVTENTLANPTDSKGGFGEDGTHPKWDWEGLNLFAKTYIDFPHTSVTNYTRDLVLNDATAHVQYDCGGVTYTREYFTSYPDRVLVMRLDASEAGKLDFTLRPTIPFVRDYLVTEGDGKGKTGTVVAEGDRITLSGTMEYYQINYEGQYKVIPTGGTMTAGDGTITVTGADSAVILFTLGTNYKYNDPGLFTRADKEKLDPNEYPHDKVTSWLDAAAAKGYDTLRADHLADYRALYSRCTLDLGSETPDVPTPTLRSRVQSGQFSRYYEELLFQYGRYLLIASSRKGALPPHLQGVWNFFDSSSYGCGYWHNINQQMNYWPAFTTNLAELFEPYVEYNEAFRAAAQANADTYLTGIGSTAMDETGKGLNGYVIATSTFPYNISKQSTTSHSGPGTAAFTSYLFWDYYLFTCDQNFLRDHTYPAIEGTAHFLSKTVEEQPDGKWLIRCSSSPENADSRISMGTAYDQTMVWENYTALLRAAEILGKTDDALLTRIRSQIDHLDPINIGWSGQIKEYRDEQYYGEFGQYDHRHISQLVGLYPGYLVSEKTPAWLDAAQVSLTERGEGSVAWSRAHRMAAWARLKDGEKAYEMLAGLMTSGRLAENLWNSNPYFQIDAEFGATAGIAETLLQSHEGYLEFLPALPDAWATGSFRGMTARGGFEADAEWADGLATKLTVRSNAGKTLCLRYPNVARATVTDADGAAVSFTADGTDVISFPTVAGGTYVVTNIPAHTTPAAPTALTAQPEHDTVKLQWTGSADAESYNLYAASNDAPDYVRIASNVRAEEYTARDVVGTDRVTFKVTAVDAAGRESKGATAVKLPNPAPEAVRYMDLASGARQFAVTAESFDTLRVYCGDTLVLETESRVFVLDSVDPAAQYSVSCVTADRESSATAAEKATGDALRNVFLGADVEFSIPHYTPTSDPASTKYAAEKAVDGDSTTRWAGATTTDNWRTVTATVTLDAPQTIEYFVVEEYINKNAGTRAGDVTLEVWDGSAWQTVIAHTALTSTVTSGNLTHNVLTPDAPVTGEKFRYTFVNNSGDSGALTLFELQAFAQTPAMADKQALYAAVTRCAVIDAAKLLALPQTLAFTAAFDAAKAMLNDDSAVQAAIDTAATALNDAAAAIADVPANAMLGAEASGTVSPYSGSYPYAYLTDGDCDTRWAGAGKESSAEITVELAEAKTIDRVLIREYINSSTGTRSNDTTVEVWNGSAWQTVIAHAALTSTLDAGSSHRTTNLLTLDAPVTAQKLRFTFRGNGADGTITLFELQAGEVAAKQRAGDVNGDGTVNTKDVTTLRRYLAGGYGIAAEAGAADVNGDGAVNTKDVTTLRRYLAGGYGITLD